MSILLSFNITLSSPLCNHGCVIAYWFWLMAGNLCPLDLLSSLPFHWRHEPAGMKLLFSLNCFINTLRLRQNSRKFHVDIFKRIFVNENILILIKISLKFVPRGPIDNIPVLVQIMAWCQPGDKPLSEPMMVRLPTHISSLSLNESHSWGKSSKLLS